jgi:light-regulated signal transduction histidine kinase (bacteriophytochrome)
MSDNEEDIFGKAISQLIHDIRNPLNIIVGFSSIIQIDDSINEEIRSYLKKIFQSGMLIEQLLSNIDYYMMDKMEPEESGLDLILETDNFYNIKNEILKEKEINVSKYYEEKIISNISPEIYNRILDNLFQFSQKGFNIVKLKQIQIFFKSEKDELLIYYTDTSEPIFIENDYFSFDEVLKAKRGLGLEFNRKFVSLYGGNISYKYGKKWQAMMENFNPSIKTNHGFIIRIPS